MPSNAQRSICKGDVPLSRFSAVTMKSRTHGAACKHGVCIVITSQHRIAFKRVQRAGICTVKQLAGRASCPQSSCCQAMRWESETSVFHLVVPGGGICDGTGQTNLIDVLGHIHTPAYLGGAGGAVLVPGKICNPITDASAGLRRSLQRTLHMEGRAYPVQRRSPWRKQRVPSSWLLLPGIP
jgi:hypothetical protein